MLLFVKPFVWTIEETRSTGYTGYWATIFGVTVDYDLRPNIAHQPFQLHDRRPRRPRCRRTNRSDDYITFGRSACATSPDGELLHRAELSVPQPHLTRPIPISAVIFLRFASEPSYKRDG